jgi:putative hemolysin
MATNEGFSRIPVFENDIDNIVGIIYVKDLLHLVGCKDIENYSLSDFIRSPHFVPETNRLRELLSEFTEKKLSIAVVVDEYGGTAGIVTMEDILESIVGNIRDEYDNDEENDISKISDGIFEIDGTTTLQEVEKLLNIEIGDEFDCDTLGGLITDILGRIPSADESPDVELCGIKFTVLSVEDRRIARVKAERL